LGLVEVKLEHAHQERSLISLRISSLFLGFAVFGTALYGSTE
jgi:hypothetical protein